MNGNGFFIAVIVMLRFVWYGSVSVTVHFERMCPCGLIAYRDISLYCITLFLLSVRITSLIESL